MNIAIESLEKAREYLSESNYGRAFAHYLIVLQILNQEDRNEFEEEFLFTWSLWKNMLYEREKYDNLISCFDLAETYFPKGVQELNELGVLSIKANKFRAAKILLEATLKRNPTYLPAEHNLQSVRYALVERWHFRMLNDYKRNKAYFEAIAREISNGHNNVIDIGTGTGIFSLFASKKTNNIIACEESEIMFEIANKIIRSNNDEKINLLNVHSADLPSNCVKNKFTLAVTEILDSGIFGEHILETLINAWENLLDPQAKVIPSHVEVYISGISCETVALKSRVTLKQEILHLNDFCISCNTEPYDTENLNKTPFIYITDTQMCLKIDFNNLEQLKTVFETAEYNPKVRLKCILNGQIDSFVIWFKLYLNESIFISNNPTDSMSCWEQAIINLKHPLIINEKNMIDLKISCADSCLKICDIQPNFENISKHDCFTINKDEICLLNDSLLIKSLDNLSERLPYRNFHEVNILDLSQFPILGLLFLKKGSTLFCRVHNETKTLLQKICITNKLDYSKINFLTYFDFPNLKFDVIYQNLINNSGLLNENEVVQRLILSKYLKTDGIFLPQEVNIWAQIVFCEWLENVTKMDDKNTCGLKIAEIMNEFKTTEQRDLNLDTLNYIPHSEPQKIGSIVFQITEQTESINEIQIIKNGTPNAILYWFDVNFYEDISITTKRTDSFTNNAAIMIDNLQDYSIGDKILLHLKQHEGLLKIFICD